MSYLIRINKDLYVKLMPCNSSKSAPEILLVQFSRTVLVFFLFLSFSPRLTVIVVKKRVGARFFAEIGGGLKNPPPGTVVDTVVTRPEW